MSITRLQQARQMFQFGGGADMGASSGPSGPPGGGEGVDRPTMANITGPAPTVDMSHFGDPDPEVNVPTSQRKDTITSFLNNFNAQRKSMGFRVFLYLIFMTGVLFISYKKIWKRVKAGLI